MNSTMSQLRLMTFEDPSYHLTGMRLLTQTQKPPGEMIILPLIPTPPTHSAGQKRAVGYLQRRD